MKAHTLARPGVCRGWRQCGGWDDGWERRGVQGGGQANKSSPIQSSPIQSSPIQCSQAKSSQIKPNQVKPNQVESSRDEASPVESSRGQSSQRGGEADGLVARAVPEAISMRPRQRSESPPAKPRRHRRLACSCSAGSQIAGRATGPFAASPTVGQHRPSPSRHATPASSCTPCRRCSTAELLAGQQQSRPGNRSAGNRVAGR